MKNYLKYNIIILFSILFSICINFEAYGKTLFVTEKTENNNYFISLGNNEPWLNVSDIDALLEVNGEIIKDIYPIIDNEYSLIPIGVVSEKLGAKADYDALKREVTIKNSGDEILLTIDSNIAYVNGSPIKLGVAAKIINSRTYVPTRFVTENMGLKIDYISDILVFDKDIQYNYNLNKKYLPIISINESSKSVTWKNERIITKSDKFLIRPFDNLDMEDNTTLVFCNFPEAIFDNSFLETFINQKEVVGYGRVFVSHFNYSKKNIDYVIRFENKKDNPVQLSIVGDSKTQNEEPYTDQVVIKNNQDFYNKLINQKIEKYIINPNEKFDIVIENLQSEKFISSQIDFFADKDLLVTAFIMENTGSTVDLPIRYKSIETPNKAYDYNYIPESYASEIDSRNSLKYYTVYSGYSNGYNISALGKIKASEFKENNIGIGFETGGLDKNINERNNIREIYDVHLVEPRGENSEIDKATWILNIPYVGDSGSEKRNRTRNYGNLGNWGIDYHISTYLENDTLEDKVFTYYLVAPYQSTVNIITPENEIYTQNINNKIYESDYKRSVGETEDTIYINNESKKWNVVEVTVPAGETKKINYTYVLGTDCVANVFHVWECR